MGKFHFARGAAIEWSVCMAVLVSIGRPSPQSLCNTLDEVKRHIQAWRQVRIGQILWESVRYRAASTPVDVPVTWRFSKPSEWIDAVGEISVRHEFQTMAILVGQTPSEFHSTLVRRRSLWLGKPLEEVLQASRLAMALEPGCAQGQPLRTISLEGVDTKFFERNSKLLTALLDVRFDGEVSLIGLEGFLGAFREGDHWLLVMDLDGSLLPFRKMRVRSSELKQATLPGSHLIIIENEACQHQLPSAKDTIAVLGAGFDLSWTECQWLATKKVAYWGDIDTWGLLFLSRARMAIPHLVPLLMSEEVYNELHAAAVCETVAAGSDIPAGLTQAESQLYRRLLQESRGRLEQEFLPLNKVQQRIADWITATGESDSRNCRYCS